MQNRSKWKPFYPLAKRWYLGLLGLAIAGGTFPWWRPLLTTTWGLPGTSMSFSPPVTLQAPPEEHQDDHGSEAELLSLELNPQTQKNLGLTEEFLQPVALSNFFRTVTFPAIVVGKPGRTDIHVSSPMDGIVQHVHAVSGEAVTTGELLFEVRLTYEDLVETQSQLLKSLSELEVEQREVARLEEVTRSGAIAGKVLLERQYAKEKLESSIAALKAALKLHGLSDEQVDSIVRDRKFLRDLSITAPSIDSHQHEADPLRLSDRRFLSVSHSFGGSLDPTKQHEAKPLIVDQLNASKGQGVKAGELLCSLSDYSSLYIEAKAFEQDGPAIAEVVAKDWPMEALFPALQGYEKVNGLKLAYVANSVDPQSRTLSFFVSLPNEILRDSRTAEGSRFVVWKYRVGQRLEIRMPVEAWNEQIVLPVDAAVKDGVDWFVFRQNGDHFDRVPVHVKHRDQQNVVIENDGAIFPGDVVAHRSAHQMQMALKNKSGASPDPHAGHNH